MSRDDRSFPPRPEGDPRPVWVQILIGLVMGMVALSALYFLGRQFL